MRIVGSAIYEGEHARAGGDAGGESDASHGSDASEDASDASDDASRSDSEESDGDNGGDPLAMRWADRRRGAGVRGLAARASKKQAARKPRAKKGAKKGAAPYDGLIERTQAQIEHACTGEEERDESGFLLHRFTFDRDPSVFDDVGGVLLWKRLNDQLKQGRLGR